MGLELVYSVDKKLPLDSKYIYGLAMLGYTLAGALGYLQALHPDEILVFVDDDILFVVDREKGLQRKTRTIVDVEHYMIGIPAMTAWGVEFVTLADYATTLMSIVSLKSVRNPFIDGDWITTSVEYDLTTRRGQWYAKWTANPPATTNSSLTNDVKPAGAA